MKSYKNLIKFILLIFFILLAFYISKTYITLSPNELRDFVHGFGMQAPLIFILIYVVGTLLFFPGIILTVSGGVIFGSFYGTIYNIIAAVIGSTLAFIISRHLGRGFVKDIIKNKLKSLEIYDNKLEKNGFTTTLFLRLIPLFPFNALNFGLGLTKVRLRDYVLATLIGIIPGTIVYTYLGDSITMLSVLNITISVVLIILLASILPLYKKWKKKKSIKN